MHINELLNDIEHHRKQMVELAAASSLSDDKVISLSVKLDQLLNILDSKKSDPPSKS